MNTEPTKPKKEKSRSTLKLAYIGIIFILLIIPLAFIQDLVTEREQNQSHVIEEINHKWGNKVILEGPILKIPYYIGKRKEESYKNKIEEEIIEDPQYKRNRSRNDLHYFYVLPDFLDIDSKIHTDTLNRSIYQSVVYTSDIKVKGHFPKSILPQSLINNNTILWDRISIQLLSSNLKGIKSGLNLKIDDQNIALKSKRKSLGPLNILESERVHLQPKDSLHQFSITLEIAGSRELQFIPIGKETTAKITSDWNSPGFNGNFLPDPKSKIIDKSGFSAQWKILQVNRGFEQIFNNTLPDLAYTGFGVNLIIPIDEYHKSERSVKYGYLVIGLTFLVFFLIQSFSGIQIHPVQYILIGLDLCMFYTLLLSITEHTTFLTAYLIATSSVIGLISFYSRSILNSFKFMAFISGSLFTIYTFILVIIQIENYALLVGSVGLFAILSIIMVVSRKIDWNKTL